MRDGKCMKKKRGFLRFDPFDSESCFRYTAKHSSDSDDWFA